MSAIVGIYYPDGRPVDRVELERMVDSLAHRGPDDAGAWNEGPIGLTRISEASGFVLREGGYVDKCHLCQDVRTYLRPLFPDVLCPDNYYPPMPNRETSDNSMKATPNSSPDRWR